MIYFFRSKGGPYQYEAHKEEFDTIVADCERVKSDLTPSARIVYKLDSDEYYDSSFFALQLYLLAVKLARNGIPYIDKKEIIVSDKLGEGSFGVATKCEIHNSHCVLKTFNGASGNIREIINAIDNLYVEFRAARMGTHPNVVSILGFTLDEFGIIMEFAECGDLSSYIKKNFETLDLTKKYRIAAGIANGLDWLNSVSGVVHRDLKPDNILLDKTLTPKVSGFRIVEYLKDANDVEFEYDGDDLLYSPPGTIERNREPTKTTDESSVVRAYGLILFFIMTGKEVSTRPSRSAKQACPRRVVVPDKFKDLISACISKDMASRPRFTDIRDLLWSAYLGAEIPQEEPRSFWNPRFSGKVEVSFDEIISEPVPEKVKDILCGGRTRTITPSRFSLLYRAFGAWYGAKYAEALSLISQEWFMEDQGAAALSNYPDGTFYVRIASASSPAPFTLEVSNNGKNKKVKISTKIVDKRKVFFLDGVSEAFSSVGSIIDYLKGKGIINDVYKPQKSGYVSLVNSTV